MKPSDYIGVSVFCSLHELDSSFIGSLEEAGLLEMKGSGSERLIPQSELERLEKMARLHRELEVNVAGIAVVIHLLERMDQLQQEMKQLKSRVRFYEEE